MKLKNGMLLFHGSYTAVENIDLKYCMPGKDFGRGFYLTSDINQARAFIRSVLDRGHTKGTIPQTQNYGYVSSYRFRMPEEGLKIHEFEEANKEWLWFIANNRRRKLATPINAQIQGIAESDVIIGKVANDQTNPVLAVYLNGIFGDIQSERAVNEAIRQLIPDHLVNQYCFLTEKAIRCLEFQEARKYVIK
ncbi:MAG: DUF3990 domain-containing protein [Clostridia bacterium]|nr:DUF3990 domain-containing protein [Clostridia bacterium]